MIKYDTKWFKKRMRESHPKDYKDYILLSEYVNAHTKIKMKHLKCGQIIEITPNSFISGRGCFICGRKKAADKQRKSLKEVLESIPNYIHPISEYKGALFPIKVHCDHCGHDYTTSIHVLSERPYCVYCRGTYNENTDLFKEDVNNLVGNEYSVIGSYKNASTKIKMKHNKCGTIYEVTPHNFKRGRRCPKCNEPHGEIIISKILRDNHVKYQTPMSFDDLRDNRKLRYDFYIPKSNTLIEYQGEQHYKPVKRFGGVKHLKIQLLHDQLKRDYALKNGFNFVEIPYTENTEKAIFEYLSKFI